MTSNYSEELDFRLIFGEGSPQQPSLGHTESRLDDDANCYPFFGAGPEYPTGQQDNCTAQPYATPHPGFVQPMESPSRVFDCPSIQITSIPANSHQDLGAHQLDQPAGACGKDGAGSVSRDQLFLPLDPSYRDTLCPSPCSSLSSRSWLSDASSCESFSHVYDDVEAELNEAAARVRLASPLVSPQASPLPSPLTSPQASPQVSPLVSPFGSPSWLAAYGEDPWYRYQHQHQQPLQYQYAQSLSPYQSPRNSVTEETWLSPRPHSSSSRPSSRPNSPCGKRRHSSAEVIPGSASPHLSPSATPSHSPRGSVTEETWIGGATFAPYQTLPLDVDIPSKTRRTYQTIHNQDQVSLLPGQEDSGLQDQGLANPSLTSSIAASLPTLKKEDLMEHFLAVPRQFPWAKPKQVNTPLYRPSSLPLLDCPLPSQFGQYELKIELQPKPHHRAHYETEGSRGAIKSECGRHPVVKLIGYNEKAVSLQMFIGTADERYVRPHAFYQVHRITGKTVGTPSQETVIASTKVLEIPLLPENNMCASIDCAGILKLRNSDIELRKGETDVGRKNTRVRAVFRVHIPQPGGKVLSLQVASVPIECSQRLAQELPQVDSFTPACGSGGEEMCISGPNVNPESTVVFLEKSSDGKTQWEVDVKAVQEKSNNSSIVVKIPPYHKKTTAGSTQVMFYVSNGKKKRSSSQIFTYLSAVQVKQEFSVPEGNLDGHPSISSAGCINTGEQILSEQVQPLEQWLMSRSPACASSSSHLSYSPQDPSYLNHSHPGDSSLGTSADLQPFFHHPTVDFTNRKPQQNVSCKGQPGLPIDSGSRQSCKTSQTFAEQTRAQLGKEYQGMLSELGHDLPYLETSSASGQSLLTSSSVYRSGLNCVDLVQFPESSSSQVSSLSHQNAPTMVPSNSLSIKDDFMDPDLLKATSLQAASKSTVTLDCRSSQGVENVNIKQEPEEEKELTFQSIGLQDITLDDVSEIIVRDLFEIPGSGKTNNMP